MAGGKSRHRNLDRKAWSFLWTIVATVSSHVAVPGLNKGSCSDTQPILTRDFPRLSLLKNNQPVGHQSSQTTLPIKLRIYLNRYPPQFPRLLAIETIHERRMKNPALVIHGYKDLTILRQDYLWGLLNKRWAQQRSESYGKQETEEKNGEKRKRNWWLLG